MTVPSYDLLPAGAHALSPVAAPGWPSLACPIPGTSTGPRGGCALSEATSEMVVVLVKGKDIRHLASRAEPPRD